MGALDELMFGGGDQRKAYDKFSNQVWLADTVNKQRMDEFSNTPLGMIMSGLAFAGPRGGLTMGPKPLPPGGAPAPPGNYFQPQEIAHPWMRQTKDPVASFGSYAKDFRFTDPKTLASDYLQMFQESGKAAEKLSGGLHTTDLSRSAAALLQRNQSAIDQLVNQDVWGPWGSRPPALVVARKMPDGSIKYGKPGELHGDLLGSGETNQYNFEKQMGFATPGGPFLTRAEASKFVDNQSPAISASGELEARRYFHGRP